MYREVVNVIVIRVIEVVVVLWNLLILVINRYRVIGNLNNRNMI